MTLSEKRESVANTKVEEMSIKFVEEKARLEKIMEN